MLNENEIIYCLIEYLRLKHFKNIESCDTHEHGYDIRAWKEDKALYVEAKGETTSKDTNRNGKRFTSAQKHSHVAVALYKTLKTKQEHPDADVAIALPSDVVHRKLIENVQSSLEKLGIIVFFVDEKFGVEEIRWKNDS